MNARTMSRIRRLMEQAKWTLDDLHRESRGEIVSLDDLEPDQVSRCIELLMRRLDKIRWGEVTP